MNSSYIGHICMEKIKVYHIIEDHPYNGGVCVDKRKDGTYLCQMKALIAKLTRLKY